MLVLLSVLFIVSLIGNISAILMWSKRPRPNDKTASELLHDLTAYGNAIVRIERIAPQDVLLRSPRQ
jgi:hypothetical protein